jgi:glutamate racemase
VRIVDSAVTTAEALASLLTEGGITSREAHGVCQFLVTDGEERFARVGPVFLGRAIAAGALERVNL